MTRYEFKKFIISRLKTDGFTKIKVRVSLFGNRASITAKGPNGRARRIKAEVTKKHGEEIIKLDTIDQAWMDELEALAAKMDK